MNEGHVYQIKLAQLEEKTHRFDKALDDFQQNLLDEMEVCDRVVAIRDAVF